MLISSTLLEAVRSEVWFVRTFGGEEIGREDEEGSDLTLALASASTNNIPLASFLFDLSKVSNK